MSIGDTATLTGTIEHIIFQKPGNGYTVASFQPEGELFPITVVGTMPDVQLEEPVEVQGIWVEHPRYGKQLKVRSPRYVLPATLKGIEAYLASGLIGPEWKDTRCIFVCESLSGRALKVCDWPFHRHGNAREASAVLVPHRDNASQ